MGGGAVAGEEGDRVSGRLGSYRPGYGLYPDQRCKAMRQKLSM